MKKNLKFLFIFMNVLALNVFGASQAPSINAEQLLVDGIRQSDVAMVEQALNTLAGEEITFAADDQNNTPLAIAAYQGNFEVVKKLTDYLEKYFKDEIDKHVDTMNFKNYSPLARAAYVYQELTKDPAQDLDGNRRLGLWRIMMQLGRVGALITPDLLQYFPFLQMLQDNLNKESAQQKRILQEERFHKVVETIVTDVIKKQSSNLSKSLKELKEMTAEDPATPQLIKLKIVDVSRGCPISVLTLAVNSANPVIVSIIAAHLKRHSGLSAINAANQDETTALSTAATYYQKLSGEQQIKDNYVDIIKILLKNGAIIRSQDATQFPFLQRMKEELEAAEKDEASAQTSTKDSKKRIDFTQHAVQEFDKYKEISSDPIKQTNTTPQSIVKGKK